jgi:hypothetical protein
VKSRNAAGDLWHAHRCDSSYIRAEARLAPGMNEADTCRKEVVPLLQAAGWDDEPHSIAEQRTITDGRIVPVGKGFVRKPPKRVDYLLRYTRDFPLAVVADRRQHPGEGAAHRGDHGAHSETACPERRVLTPGRHVALRGKISETVIRKSSRFGPLRIRSTVSSIFGAAS